MSRPKPNVLLEYTDPKTYRSEQVLEAEAMYAVFYEGKPINLRNLNTLFNYPGAKYKRSVFPSPGHAFNLADRLNKLFKTNKFEVYKITGGTKINRED